MLQNHTMRSTTTIDIGNYIHRKHEDEKGVGRATKLSFTLSTNDKDKRVGVGASFLDIPLTPSPSV